ncbi:hypothetical protein ACFY0A_27910 [Streptomyces sp. NPDC001698]|uniref:hypothetical protein n=1 Tax=Streptomyces sp. NPDC001698 TaxID=3364601 RepID=UPI0036A4D5C6
MTRVQRRPSVFATVGIQKHASVLLLASGLVLAGCSDRDGAGDDTKATAPRSPSVESPASTQSSDPQVAQKEAVLASYSSMWAEQMQAYKKASADGTALKKYAALNALSKFQLDLAQMKNAGTVGGGEVGHAPQVTMIQVDTKLPKATVTDCIDLTKWKATRLKSGKPIPLPSNQPKRYVAVAAAERWDGRWMITDYTPHGDQAC